MFQVGEIVRVPDLEVYNLPVYGVIEKIVADEKITVHSVRTLSGLLHSRDDFELVSTNADEVRLFRLDVIILGPYHLDLRESARLLSA